MRVAKNNDCRRISKEEEKTSSFVRSSVADKIFTAAAEKAKGEILRAVKDTIASVTIDKDR